MKFTHVFLAVSSLAIVAAANPSNFIINGMPAPQTSAPYHAHLLMRVLPTSADTRVGSGVLISTLYVLTTATNTNEYNLTSSDIYELLLFHILFCSFGWWNVGLGSLQRDQLQWHESISAFTHFLFDPTLLYNNIAIIALPLPVQVNVFVAPARMPTLDQSNLPLPNQIARVNGFGMTSSNGAFATELQVLFQLIDNNDHCVAAFPFIESVQESVFCASMPNTNICFGDQGSGIVLDNLLPPVLVGIVSFTDINCDVETPTVYIRLNFYRGWIQTITGMNW